MELYILKSILIYNIYIKYNYILEERFLKEESEEIALIYQAISDFYKKNPDKDISSVDILEQIFHSCYPALSKKKRALYGPIFDRLRAINLDPERIEEYYSKLRNKYSLRKLAEAALYASQGKGDDEKVKEIYDQLDSGRPSSSDFGNSYLWRHTIPFEFSSTTSDQGNRIVFRSQTLRRSIGPLRKGDFGLVVARPEVGKTAFAVDCAAYMVPQVKTRAVYLGNEERPAMVFSRIISSFLGKSRREYTQDEARKVYEEVFKDKLILLHEPNLNHKEFYAFLREAKPELLFIDQLDKIQGFKEDRHDLELGAIYEWVRGLAAEFCPVIGMTQASESGEGKRWLEQNDIANSKTSKPGELDWILGIGKTHEEALNKIRHFHIIKNKLEGDENTIEEYRHGKFDMRIDTETSRYIDVMSWKEQS